MYKPRLSQMESLKKDMERTGVLPKHEKLLKRLAKQFIKQLEADKKRGKKDGREGSQKILGKSRQIKSRKMLGMDGG